MASNNYSEDFLDQVLLGTPITEKVLSEKDSEQKKKAERKIGRKEKGERESEEWKKGGREKGNVYCSEKESHIGVEEWEGNG